VPTSVIKTLWDSGHEILRLCDIARLCDPLPTNALDPKVIAEAQRLDAVLLSLNSDFADLVRYPPSKYEGIVALQ